MSFRVNSRSAGIRALAVVTIVGSTACTEWSGRITLAAPAVAPTPSRVPADPPTTPVETGGTTEGVIRSFWAESSGIQAGGSTVLHWVVEGLGVNSTVSIFPDPGSGPYQASGSVEVHPSDTTTYNVIVAGNGRPVAAALTVRVLPPDPFIQTFYGYPAGYGGTFAVSWLVSQWNGDASISFSPAVRAASTDASGFIYPVLSDPSTLLTLTLSVRGKADSHRSVYLFVPVRSDGSHGGSPGTAPEIWTLWSTGSSDCDAIWMTGANFPVDLGNLRIEARGADNRFIQTIPPEALGIHAYTSAAAWNRFTLPEALRYEFSSEGLIFTLRNTASGEAGSTPVVVKCRLD